MRFLLRIFSFLAALLAFVMIVVDGTTIISAKAFSYTPLGELLGRVIGSAPLERAVSGLATNVHPLLARLVTLLVFAPPAVINLAILALIFWMIGRKPPEDAVLGPA